MAASDIRLKAYAKINLGIDVIGKRDDGYHLVRMVMQSVDIYDAVTICLLDEEQIRFTCSDESLQTMDNLCVKAASLFYQKTGEKRGVDIDLLKKNPVAAGMAGGSTDAAAVLKGMNELFGMPLSKEELLELAVKVGADVPFCIDGGTALCEGIGEVLTPIDGMPDIPVLVARPDVEVSTAGIYGRLDEIGEFEHPDIDGIKCGIEAGDVAGMCKSMGNVLELVTGKEVKSISRIEGIMTDYGAYHAMMTGSGPTVFGLFPDETSAEKCMREIEKSGLCSFIKLTRMITE